MTDRYTTEDVEEAALLMSKGCELLETGVDNCTAWWQFDYAPANAVLVQFNNQPESPLARFIRCRRVLRELANATLEAELSE